MMAAVGWNMILIISGLLGRVKAGRCAAAHPIDMNNLNSDSVFPISSGRAMVIAYQTIPCNGEITAWSVLVMGRVKLSFLVWEQNSSSVYNLVGQNNFTVNNNDGINVTDFEPLPSDRITVKPGQVVGLYSIVEGTDLEAGVKAAMVKTVNVEGVPQNLTYDFEPISLKDVTSINIFSSSTNIVPNVRPLISAVIEANSLPHTPVVINVTKSTSTNTAVTIFIRITRIASTRESYFITYKGVERDMQERQTALITVTSNTTNTNSTYSYNIAGLEEGTTYLYSVTATNSAGNTTSNIMNFTTNLQGPVNYSCTNVSARQVTAEWSPPPSSLFDYIYTLNCNNLAIVTIATIVIVTTEPYTNYTCTLTARTTVGAIIVSTPTTCNFETPQDIPSGPPQDFRIVSSMTSVILQWQPPSQPNGIITRYNILSIDTQRLVLLNSSSTQYTFCGLQPGQQVSFTISASTEAGDGPNAISIIARTQEKMFSGVHQLSSKENFLNITWSPPVTPHGFITKYNVIVSTEIRPSHQNETTTATYFIIKSNPVFGLRYNITVFPLDDCNTYGDPTSIYFAVYRQSTSTPLLIVLVAVAGCVAALGLLVIITVIVIALAIRKSRSVKKNDLPSVNNGMVLHSTLQNVDEPRHTLPPSAVYESVNGSHDQWTPANNTIEMIECPAYGATYKDSSTGINTTACVAYQTSASVTQNRSEGMESEVDQPTINTQQTTDDGDDEHEYI